MSKVIALEKLSPQLSETVIFGGSFDPVHEGHISVVRKLDEKFNTVVVAPTAQNPWKGYEATSLSHRLEMLELVFKAEGLEGEVELCELEYEYSEDLLKGLRKEGEFKFWAIGEDSAESVTKWKNFEQLALTVVVVPVSIDIHSTKIRSGGESAHPAITSFIARNKLYQSD